MIRCRPGNMALTPTCALLFLRYMAKAKTSNGSLHNEHVLMSLFPYRTNSCLCRAKAKGMTTLILPTSLATTFVVTTP